MALIAGVNLVVNFGTRIILDGVSLSVDPGVRIGIVGRNGTGKTTLLRLLASVAKPDTGSVILQKGARVGYLTQDHNLPMDETLRGAAEGAFAELHRLHQELDKVFHDMADATPEQLDKLLKKQERIETDIEAAGGYAVDHKIDATLHGLGFTDAQFNIKVRDLSGGQKGRLALARLLLEKPDVLLLDEPTNHLDLDGRLWLEDFLKNDFNGAVVMISHDRYLLDNVVTKIIEVEQARLIDYPGNYHAFRETRALRRLTMHRAYEKQQDKFRQEEAYIRKYKAGQRAKQAQGRLSKLERAKEDTLERPMEMAEVSFTLPKADRSGDIVASTRGASKKYKNKDGTDKVLFHDLDMVIMRGEHWGIIGPNGAGKTTLVRAILGELPVDAGQVKLGSSIKLGYYRQSHEHVTPGETVIRYLQGVILKENPEKAMSEQQARNLAGVFLFTGQEQESQMDRLSGGERSRAVLAGLLASAKNVLVLDEPTNHLDISSAERLEDFLSLPVPATSETDAVPGGDFDGTLILISHDRAFIDATCDKLLILDGQGNAEIFSGNYTKWHQRELERKQSRERKAAEEKNQRAADEKRARAAEEAAAKKKPAPKQPDPSNPLARLKFEEIEKRIEKITTRVREIDESMGDPGVYTDAKKMSKLGDERQKLTTELEPLEFEWSRRAEEMA